MSAQTARPSPPARNVDLVTAERRLRLAEVSRGWLSAGVFPVDQGRMLAHRCAELGECNIDLDTSGRPVLWVDGTYFAVFETEVQAIRSAFPEIRVNHGA